MRALRRLALAAMLASVSAAQADVGLLMRPDVQRFIDEQVASGEVSRAELETVFANVDAKPNVITIMDKPSTARPWYQFRPNFYNEKLLQEGVAFWQKNEATLQRAQQQFGVAPEMIVAILGIETRYGRVTGSFRLADVLSTLAFDYPRRAEFFRGELAEFFRLAHSENVNALSLKGSYAGAIGMPQFMPSSFRKWAVDFDGDGHRDIWNNPADAIGSVGNYFQQHGWLVGDDVVVPVDVTPGAAIDELVADKFNLHYTVAELKAKGIVPRAPVRDEALAVLVPLEVAPGDTRYWLGLNNFYTITRYNKSTLYAMVAQELAQEIRNRYLAVRYAPVPAVANQDASAPAVN
ncbi:lytic murein transglycosylase B [Vogesella sp. LIG4]|uniref:lytic murein transglycosylase B n=1 Tax=Vogesella sp. LIG4 TaxID=1192162 RepID=UPI00081F75E9|nr:lytic murein transglycosylase B [Vogesella sp. LIG4]SCK21366.1 membrane-bound lytic murein transglycosylase B [Vogesella sp. LIG4]